MALLALSGCAAGTIGSVAAPKKPLLQVAAETCKVTRTEGDAGHTLTLNTKGKDEEANAMHVDFADVACILTATGVPDSVVAEMDRTTSMMGVQTATWGDGVKASWTYHPDNGLDIILTQ